MLALWLFLCYKVYPLLPYQKRAIMTMVMKSPPGVLTEQTFAILTVLLSRRGWTVRNDSGCAVQALASELGLKREDIAPQIAQLVADGVLLKRNLKPGTEQYSPTRTYLITLTNGPWVEQWTTMAAKQLKSKKSGRSWGF